MPFNFSDSRRLNGNCFYLGAGMSWRDDSTATNRSLISSWAHGVLRPLGRIFNSAGIPAPAACAGIHRAYAAYAQEKARGHAGSGSRYENVLALGSITGSWARSPEWTDENGLPRELALRHGDPSGFGALVRSVDPLLAVSAVLKALTEMNVVCLGRNGLSVRLLRHTVVHSLDTAFSIEPVLLDLQRFAETIEHNLFAQGFQTGGRLQRTAIRLSLNPANFPDFARYARRLGQGFLDAADDRLTAYPLAPNGDTFGVGAFVFYEPPSTRSPAHDDSTATNLSLLAQWADVALRPVIRILKSAGVSEATSQQCMESIYDRYAGESQRGRHSSGSNERSVLALAPIAEAWTGSSAWTDQSGAPRELSLDPNDPQGFGALVRSINAALEPGVVLHELERLGMAHPSGATGRVRLLRSTLLYTNEDSFLVQGVLRDLQRFAETIEHNIFRDRPIEDGRFQTTAARLNLASGHFDEFSRFIRRAGQAVLESADDRLNSYAPVDEMNGASYGVGVFVFLERTGQLASNPLEAPT